MTNQKIVIAHHDVVDIINTEDIIYCQANNGYTTLNLAHQDEQLDVSKSLTKFAEKLNTHIFLRINQSYVVNINYILRIDKRKKTVELPNRVRLPFTITIKKMLEKFDHAAQRDRKFRAKPT